MSSGAQGYAQRVGLPRNMRSHDAFPDGTSLAIEWNGCAGPPQAETDP
jgi:hypothetical protein